MSVRAVLSASAVAFTVTVSVLKLSVIEVAAEPAVMLMPLSAASPVVTVSAPVREPAAISPTNPVTTSAADPASVSTVFCANAVAVTVTVSVLKLSVIEVAAEPVVIAMVLSVASPVSHRQRTGQRASRDVPDQAGYHLRRRADKRQSRIVGQRRRVDIDVTPLESVTLVAPAPVITLAIQPRRWLRSRPM